jgi:Type II secretion system (T2SS), protein E, N-terminal domain
VAPLSLSSYGGGGRVLRLAMADPTDAVAVAEVEHVTGCRVEPVLMTVSAVEELVEKTYRALVTEVIRRGGEPRPAEERSVETGSAEARSDAAEAARSGGRVAPRTPPSGVAGRAGSVDGPVTVPFHKLSDEADLDTRLRALTNVLLARRLVSDDELEEEVRQLMRRPEGGGRGGRDGDDDGEDQSG